MTPFPGDGVSLSFAVCERTGDLLLPIVTEFTRCKGGGRRAVRTFGLNPLLGWATQPPLASCERCVCAPDDDVPAIARAKPREPRTWLCRSAMQEQMFERGGCASTLSGIPML